MRLGVTDAEGDLGGVDPLALGDCQGCPPDDRAASPAVALLPDASIVVGWRESTGVGASAWVRRVRSDGGLEGQLLVATPDDHAVESLALTTNPWGDVGVAWIASVDGGDPGVFFRRVRCPQDRPQP